MAHVFVSYLREDRDLVDRLVTELRIVGIDVWVDRERLQPGERWRDAIRAAIRSGACFIACFSAAYAERERSFMNEELTIAVEELRLRPTDRTWFIPVLLGSVGVPDREIGANQTLRDLQWVDLHSSWDAGVTAIIRAVVALGLVPADAPTPSEVALAQAIIKAQQASLAAMQQTIEIQRALLDRRPGAATEIEGANTHLTDVVSLRSVESYGVEINLPDLFRRVRALFSNRAG